MTKKGNTKKALLMSALSLLLCVSMLVGTTFAWFTDEVVSGNNIIAAGNLDVELTHRNYTNRNDKEPEYVSGATDLFEDVARWEPGAVAYENFTVSNVGTLDLKYLLSINFGNENAVVTNGKAYTLSQVLKVAVVKGGVNTEASRETIVANIAEEEWKSLATFSVSGNLYDKADVQGRASEQTYGIVIYWQPSENDNNWNVNNGKEVSDYAKTGKNELRIELGVKLEATQLVSESDSFDEYYDAKAPWLGSVGTVPAENAEGEIIITSAEELAALAVSVNSGNNYAGKTIKLGADIDLNNIEWTPIGVSGANFNGTFDGNDFKIYNLNVSGTEGVGLIGFAGNAASIYNVHIVNANVNGNHWVGTVLGYGYLAENTLKGCTVENATVVCTPILRADGKYDDGDKAGVIAGMAINGNIYDNTVKNSTVYAYRDMGGIVGCAQAENRSIEVSGNTAEGVTLVYVGVLGIYDDGKTPNNNANVIVGRENPVADYTVTIEKNVCSEYVIPEDNEKGAVVITTAEELYTFAASVNGGITSYKGETVLLGADIDLLNADWTPIGNGDNKFQGTFDGQYHTISNLNISMAGKSNVGLFGMTTNGTIKNLVVENAIVTGRLNVGVVAGTPYTSKYENITVKGHVEVNGMAYVGAVGGKNAYANWNNITVDVDETSYVKADSVENGTAYRTYVGGVIGFMGEGGHSVSNVTSNIDVIGSTCDVGGIVGIAHYGNSFINCVSSGDVTIYNAGEAADAEEMGGIAGVWHNENGTKVTFAGCKYTGKLSANITDGVDLSDNIIHGAAYSATGTGKVIVADAAASSEEELVEALQNGGEVIVFEDIVLEGTVMVPEGVTVNIDLGGKSITSTVTAIENSGTMTITNGKIENITVNGASAIVNKGEMVLDRAEIVGAPIGEEGYPGYAVNTYGKLTIEEGTTISSDRGAIAIKGNGTTTINGGVFTNNNINRVLTSHVVDLSDDAIEHTLVINGGTFQHLHEKTSGGVVICNRTKNTIYVNGGKFSGGNYYGNDNLSDYGYGGTFSVTGGTFSAKPAENYIASGYTVAQNNDGTWSVSGTKVSSSSELSSAISAGEAVELVEDIQFSSAINNDAKIDLNGNTFEATNTIQLGSNADLSMADGDYVVNSTYGHIDVRPDSAEGSVVTFENVDFSFNKRNNTYGPSTNRLGTVLEFCANESDAKAVIVFRNCTFDNAQVLFEGMSGKTGEFEATFENCTFNALTSSAPIYVQNYVKGTINVIGCTFNLECTSSTASAISVSNSSSTAVTVKAENNTINAKAATPTDDSVTGVDVVKVNGTPANIKFISIGGTTSTATESGTVKTGIAAQ